jgi:predicted nucleic acid-binding protein
VDTNVLVYAEGFERRPEDAPKIVVSRRVLGRLAAFEEGWIAPIQVLAELHNVLTRHARLSAPEATERSSRLARSCTLAPTTAPVLADALVLAKDHHLQIFDAIILACAAEAGCDLLLSEDMHAGFAWRGVIVANPFAQTEDARLVELTAE